MFCKIKKAPNILDFSKCLGLLFTYVILDVISCNISYVKYLVKNINPTTFREFFYFNAISL